jgi:hypothetical protein
MNFKKGYQPITNLVNGENGDTLANPHKTFNMCKNYFSQLLNVHRVSDARQMEYIQLGLVSVRLKLLLQSRKSINHHVLFKFQQS